MGIRIKKPWITREFTGKNWKTEENYDNKKDELEEDQLQIEKWI